MSGHFLLLFLHSLTFVRLPDLIESLGERSRVQEEEDCRGDGDQCDQLAQPERKDNGKWGE